MNKNVTLIIIIMVGIVGYGLGRLTTFNTDADSKKSQLLREDGYKFVKPLLLTDHGNDNTSTILQGYANHITKIIDSNVDGRKLITASVYYRNLNSGEQININGSTKYFPASLSKVPLMMAFYKLAESNPELLTTHSQIVLSKDYNLEQEIPPAKYPQTNSSYTIQELIDLMIKYSDNASFNILFGFADSDKSLRTIFKDLELHYPYDQTIIKDVFTPKEFSRFLRLLYNATYLNEIDSERALQLMNETVYSSGIKAGIGNDVAVSHKFGLHTQRDERGVLLGRQLHDCGIVYKSNNPYLLCIMTKSGAGELKDVESVIAEISKYVYENLPTK